MVVAEQMQGTMDEKVRQLCGQRVTAGMGLALGSLSGNDDIPQQLGMEMGKGPLSHGKGQHIGRPVDAAILRIEPPDMGVIDKAHTQLTVPAVESREQPLLRLSERPRVDRDDLLLIPEAEGHSCHDYAVASLPIRR